MTADLIRRRNWGTDAQRGHVTYQKKVVVFWLRSRAAGEVGPDDTVISNSQPLELQGNFCCFSLGCVGMAALANLYTNYHIFGTLAFPKVSA